MIDIDVVEGFEWDAGNDRKSADKHGVTRAEAEQVFFNAPIVIVKDVLHSELEDRFHALGKSNEGRLLQITFTMRDEGKRIRVISTRAMNKKERTGYGKA